MKNLENNKVGIIIPQNFGSVGEYDAFIPHKLFTKEPKININQTMIKLLSEADRTLGELKGLTEILPNPDLFIAQYIKKEALLSSQIEGTQCSLDEVLQVNDSNTTMKPIEEVVNYINAMNYGLSELKKIPMSIRLLHKIHEKLLDSVRGKNKSPGTFKKMQNWIGPAGCTLNEAVFVPPPPNMMIEYMGDFENYYHRESEYPPLINAAIMHAYFETIHPYADGNGRLGRLLITFMLCEKKILDKPLLYLSLFFKEHKSSYYNMLMDLRFKGQWEEWVLFFLRGVRNTSKESVETAKDILELFNRDKEKLNIYKNYSLTFPLFDLLCKYPLISIAQAVKELRNTSYPVIKNMFIRFESIGILKKYDQKVRNKMFVYQTYLAILKRGTEY
ncbi:MAG: Fic family protein [Bacteroidetes bacterium]|nr:Fic family protein [Bacteroidota bacterium]